MATFKNLITAQKVVDLAINNKNIALGYVKDSKINAAQEKRLKPLLGKDMYDDILKQVFAGTPEGAYSTTFLTDFLEPALAYFVKWQVLPDIALQLSNQGVVIQSPDFSKGSSSKERAEARDQALADAQALSDRMIDYIVDVQNGDIIDTGSNFDLYSFIHNVENRTPTRGNVIF